MIIATVKAVTSGDTVVLKSTKSGAEKVLSLAFISAPRLRREGDEVCCFPGGDRLGCERLFTKLAGMVVTGLGQPALT